jgi:hypothetical protein
MSGDHNQYQKDKSYLDFECPRCGHCCQALETEKQEPVAWRTFDGEGGYDYRSYEMNETYDKEWAERNPNHKGWVEPLYTAPPKREWVGLTDEEHDNIKDN